MKRNIIGLLCVCLLFSGCGTGFSQPVQTESPTTEALPVQVHLPLLEQGSVLKESGNLRYIPNAAVESMTAPEMRLFGHGLLLSECIDNKLVIKHISLEDGSLVAEGSVTAAAGTKLFIGSGEIGLCDRMFGQISILDEQFRLLRFYDVTSEGDDWYLNSELDTLYIFYSDRGLLARNLITGEDTWLVDNGFRVTPIGSSGGYVIFEYTDRADQISCTRCLNLSTATLETIPIDGSATRGTRQGETWMLQNRNADGVYTVVQGESANCFMWEGSDVRLLSPRRHLLAADSAGRNMTLYDTDGSYISECSLPQNSHAVVGKDFVWSGYWEGYFFTDYMDSSCRLMFWDVNADCEGENLQMLPSGEAHQSQSVLEQPLYDRAAELSQRFGVDIRIAEQCGLDYSHYNSYAMTDPAFIRSALDILEETLSLYPQDFFRQLRHGAIDSIRIELVGGLTVKDEVDTHPDSAGGFTQDKRTCYLMVLDGYLLQKQTLFHEISHIIDSRLEWDSLIRKDALYSEEAWLDLQPEGFDYARSYTDIPEGLLHFVKSGYFITEYSLTFPTEDRAVLMESAMNGYSWDFEPGSGAAKKMQYYADCIRDCFDTEGWPAVTLWEQVLK